MKKMSIELGNEFSGESAFHEHLSLGLLSWNADVVLLWNRHLQFQIDIYRLSTAGLNSFLNCSISCVWFKFTTVLLTICAICNHCVTCFVTL